MPRKKWNHSKIFTSPSQIDKSRRRNLTKFLKTAEGRNSPLRKSTNSPARLLLANLLYSGPVSPKSSSIKSPAGLLGPQARVLSPRSTGVSEDAKERSCVTPRSTFRTDEAEVCPNLQEPQIYLMNDIKDLMTDIEPGSIVGVDIDETLICTRNAPSLLLTEEGVKAFQGYVHERFQNFEAKNQQCRLLQRALQDKIPVEESTTEVIRALQNKGCYVFGLTARYSEMAQSTKKILTELGIDLARTAPLPAGKTLVDPVTEAVGVDGIIYCNNVDKGAVLDRFAPGVMLPEILRRKQQETVRDKENAPNPPAAGEAESSGKPAPVQYKLYMVDDRFEMCENVWNGLTHGAAKRIPIQFPGSSLDVACYHYCPPHLLSETKLDHPHTKRKVMLKQFETLIDEGRVLSDREALMLLQ